MKATLRYFTIIKHFLTVSLLGLLAAGWSCNGSDNSKYKSAGTEVKVRDLQNLFAEVLEPKPETIALRKNTLKEAFLNNMDALWLVANEPDVLKQTLLPESMQSVLLEKAKALRGRPQHEIRMALEYMSPGDYEKLQKSLDDALESKFQLSSLTEMLEKIDIPQMGQWTDFFREALAKYFLNLSFEEKKRIVAFMAKKTTASSTNIDKLLSIIYGAGPLFHKIMQLLGDRLEPGTNAELLAFKAGLSNVKNELPSIDKYYLDKYIKDIEGKGSICLILGDTLGAASVGQTFVAEMKIRGADGSCSDSNATKIVVKFMRPGIEELAAKEAKILRDVANKISPMMLASFNDIYEQILEEMDYNTELERLNLGYSVYNNENTPMRVVRPIANFPQSKHYMAMELAQGRTFDKVGIDTDADNPDKRNLLVDLMIKGQLLELLAEEYFEQALFRQPVGFFHGDLHEGNMLMWVSPRLYEYFALKNLHEIKMEDAARSLNPEFIKLTLIDFGNAHSLTKEERHLLLNLFVSSVQVSNNVDAFLDTLQGFWPEYGNLPQEKKTQVREALIKDAYDWGSGATSKMPAERLNHAINALMLNDARPPPILIAFLRSILMIQNSFVTLYRQVCAAGFDEKEFSSIGINWAIDRTVVARLYASSLITGYGTFAGKAGSDIGLSWRNFRSIATWGWIHTIPYWWGSNQSAWSCKDGLYIGPGQ